MIDKIINMRMSEITDEEKTIIKNLLKEVKEKMKKRNIEKNESSPKVKELFEGVNFDLVYKKMIERFNIEPMYELYKEIFYEVANQEENDDCKGLLNYTSQGDLRWDVFMTEYDSVIHYAIDLVKYKELANYKVSKDSIEEFEKEEIVAAFLYEFSWNPTDEGKELYENELNEAKREAEQEMFAQKCETDGTIPFNQKELEEDEIKPSKTFTTIEELFDQEDFLDDKEPKNGKNIRELINNSDRKKVKESFVKIVNNYESEYIKIKKEEAENLFNKRFFEIISSVNNKYENKLNQSVVTDVTVDYLMTEKEGSEITCIFNGKNVLEIIDEELKEDYMYKLSSQEDIVAEFIFAYLSDELTYHNKRCHDEMDYIEILIRKEKAKKILKEIFEENKKPNRAKKSKSFSHVVREKSIRIAVESN